MTGPLERATAVEYASWFRALADATRVQIVTLLARRGEPMTVGAITAELDVGQSTVSEHLKILRSGHIFLSLATIFSTSYHLLPLRRPICRKCPVQTDRKPIWGRPN
jgi:predicted Zn-ribbon and HTH transcriptional regulator